MRAKPHGRPILQGFAASEPHQMGECRDRADTERVMMGRSRCLDALAQHARRRAPALTALEVWGEGGLHQRAPL